MTRPDESHGKEGQGDFVNPVESVATNILTEFGSIKDVRSGTREILLDTFREHVDRILDHPSIRSNALAADNIMLLSTTSQQAHLSQLVATLLISKSDPFAGWDLAERRYLLRGAVRTDFLMHGNLIEGMNDRVDIFGVRPEVFTNDINQSTKRLEALTRFRRQLKERSPAPASQPVRG